MRLAATLALLGALVLGCKTREPPADTLAQPQNRFVMGLARDLGAVPDVDPEQARVSFSYRRGKAWELVQAVLAPVAIPESFHVSLEPGVARTLPLWSTWYDAQEVRSIARGFFAALKAAPAGWKACAANAACLDGAATAGFVKNVDAVNWSYWGQGTFEQYLGQLKTAEDLAGFVEVTKPTGVSARGFTLFSPSLVRHYLRHFAAVIACEGTASCFGEEMPRDAVAVKTTWSRVDKPVADVDTSPAGLARIFASGNWLGNAGAPPPLPAQAAAGHSYVMMSRELGQPLHRYALTGLHVASKALPDWLWVSLWWAKDADADFGADRPEWVPAPWTGYKLCATTHFREEDAAPWSAYEGTSLGAALKSLAQLSPDYSWCSNSFVEVTKGHARTNCVGCHQHAGRGSDPGLLPQGSADFGRARDEGARPGDYLWSLEAEPDDFRQILGSEQKAAGLEP